MAKLQRNLNRERTWRRHIAKQPSRGQTIHAYGVAHLLRETSFYFWRYEIARRDREAAAESKAAPAFVPVSVIDTPAISEAPIDLRLAGGHRVRVRSGCDHALLADVIRLLRDAHADPAMLTLPPSTRVFVATKPADMRRSFDGLLAIVRDVLGHDDPLAGHLFAFRNKSGDRLKILWWGRDVLAIFYKRLEEGGFP